MTEAYGSPDDVAALDGGHLDLPLARTVRLDALRAAPARAQIEHLRHDAAEGRVPGAAAVLSEERRWSPARAALWVGGAFGAVIGVASVITILVNRDPDMLLFAVLITAFFVVVPGAIAFVGVSVGRRNRWRRHAQVHAFAVENGLRHALTLEPGSAPRGVMHGTGSHRNKAVTDVVAGQVRSRAVLAGMRTSDQPSGDTSTTRRLMWVALAERAGEPSVRPDAFRERVRDLLGRGRVVVERDQEWLVVGVEHHSAGWDRLGGLLEAIDLVLLGEDGVRDGGGDPAASDAIDVPPPYRPDI